MKQRDPFGAAVCGFWLGTAPVEAGVYAADARAHALNLVSPFGAVDVDRHDWAIMLMKFGKLSKDREIGALLAGAGRMAIVGSLLAGAWILRIMATTGGPGYIGGTGSVRAERLQGVDPARPKSGNP